MTPSNVKEYPRIIKAIKYNFSKRINIKEDISQSFSRNKREMKPIWQKRYYEHTIRDEEDYQKCLEY
jgi:putative transposase